MLTIYAINEATTLPEKEVFNICWAVNHQLVTQYGPAWRSDVRCVYVPKTIGVPDPPMLTGKCVLHFLDTSDQQGALGYHDEDGNELPSAKVFVQDAVKGGDQPSEVASHEALELATDPHCNLSALTGDGSRLYALEVGDPVQGTGYDVLAPENKTMGITVANFALPGYFDPASTASIKVDFRHVLSAPFTLAPGGYMSYVDSANWSAGWQQQFGQERSELPAWASRHAQRASKWVQPTT
jgi:hypothetical protein